MAGNEIPKAAEHELMMRLLSGCTEFADEDFDDLRTLVRKHCYTLQPGKTYDYRYIMLLRLLGQAYRIAKELNGSRIRCPQEIYTDIISNIDLWIEEMKQIDPAGNQVMEAIKNLRENLFWRREMFAERNIYS